MNILMLTYEIVDQGGNFIRCFSLAKEMVKQGHLVVLVTSNKKHNIFFSVHQRSGVTIVEPPCIFPFRMRHNGTSVMQIIARCWYVARHRLDIVHGFGHRPAVVLPALLHRMLYHRPYIADWADLWGWGGLASYRGGVLGSIVGLLDDVVEKIVYRAADAVTVISTDLFHRIIEFGIPKQRVSIVPPGASTDTTHPISKQLARRKLRIPQSAHVVVYMGNAPYDAQLLGLSFIEIARRDPKALLLCVGRPIKTFQSMIESAELQKRVMWFGFVPHEHISELLFCGDVMLLPYTDRAINQGRYPNKIGDYLAAGRPVVANPTGDVRSLIRSYRVGLFAPEDPTKFADVALRLLRNKSLARRIGKNAYRLARSSFSWAKRAQQVVDFYDRVLSEKSNRMPTSRA